jgi:5'-nucleotidase
VAAVVCAVLMYVLASSPTTHTKTRGATLTLSIVGTSDLHGYFLPRAGRGGIGQFAGYMKNLRAARESDGGAVLLIDAGDTFQGGVESDLSEGAVVVDAYNALGYAALAVGNHEFDFGSADRPGARQDAHGDPRGALKAMAARARFPFLAANLLDESTGRPVGWANVRPSTLIDAAGVRVGIVGVMTYGALRATLPLNIGGLAMAPLVETVTLEAGRLRAAGAQIVILGAHAGGSCFRFDNPSDLSSCDGAAEIFDVARALPAGLVNAIVAGHTHDGLAHIVNGIPIVQAYSTGRAFGRIDLAVDRASKRVTQARPFAPREICDAEDPLTLRCAANAREQAALPAPVYEGRPVAVDARVLAAMEPALDRVRQLQAMPLGAVLETALPRTGEPESPLGNLFADALREESGADVALNNNSIGGLRADLPDGPVTFGRLYDAFPFDNRMVRVNMSGDELERGIENALRRGRRGAFGISGARVRVNCTAEGVSVQLFRPSGQPIGSAERVVVAGMDSMLGGQLFAVIIPPGTIRVPLEAPVLREVVEDWIRERGHALRASRFLTPEDRRIEFGDASASACIAQ